MPSLSVTHWQGRRFGPIKLDSGALYHGERNRLRTGKDLLFLLPPAGDRRCTLICWEMLEEGAGNWNRDCAIRQRDLGLLLSWGPHRGFLMSLLIRRARDLEGWMLSTQQTKQHLKAWKNSGGCWEAWPRLLAERNPGQS